MTLSRTLVEAWSLGLEVAEMEDYLLVDNVNLINEDDFIDKIIYSFSCHGILTDEERSRLINYYVLYYCEEYIDL
jgi:hypothetical protein